MSSLETRLARAAAAAASTVWRQHKGMCAACSRVGKDRGAMPCSSGAELRNEHVSLAAAARLEAQKDRVPMPGSETLF